MRVLLLFPTSPFPPINGMKHRFAHLALHLAREHRVAVAFFTLPGEEADWSGATGQFDEVRPVPEIATASPSAAWFRQDPSDVFRYKSPQMFEVVDELIRRHEPEVLVSGEPALTQYLVGHGDRVRVLDYVCEATLQFERMMARTTGASRILWSLRKKKYAAFLRRIAPEYDVFLVNSEEDRQALAVAAPNCRRVELVPNGLALESYPADLAEPEPDVMIYPGSIAYSPNRDAVEFMGSQILPRIRSRRPQVRFQVTGALPRDQPPPEAPGLEYTGYVPDVKSAIASAWLCAVPLRLGAGGTRFKVLEALALGAPMVSTAIGIEGVAVTDRMNVLMAEDAQTFADCCLQILESPELRNRLSREGRRLIEDRYSWSTLGDQVTGLFEELIAVKRTSPGAGD